MIYLSLGTNIGDRLQNLLNAVLLCEQKGIRLRVVSSVYETEPWGFESETSFYNMVIACEFDREAIDLLELTQTIELEIGRKPKTLEGYESRIIDIDILFVDEKVINMANLQIPHEKMCDRKFVLLPLNELNPLFIHPLRKISVNELLEICKDDSQINLVVTNIDFSKKIRRIGGQRKK